MGSYLYMRNALLAAFLLLVCSPASAGTFIFGAFQDAVVGGGGIWDDMNFGTSEYLLTNPPLSNPEPPYEAFGLIQYDLSPIRAMQITSATLRLAHIGFLAPLGATMDLYRNLEPWEERTVTYGTQPEFESFPITSTTLIGDGQTFVYRFFDLTFVAQTWADNPEGNFGLTLVQNPRQEYITIPSRESSVTSWQPVLFVEAEPLPVPHVPEPATVATIAGGLAALVILRRKLSR